MSGAAVKIVMLVVAALLLVLGAVFTLQGIGVLGGSAMTGDRTWAIIGPIMAVVGVALGLLALRRGARSG